MSIPAGAVVSRYQIIGRLGAGGMGEVYKAHDTVLGRTIALKILPQELVRNDERMRRFIQEARSASSLNHPNIVTIHEIGEAPLVVGDTAEASSTHFIAMELVDGVTLKRKVHEEPTKLRTLVGYVAQAAEGLAKAHAAGIVHRDLKPENIMISADGFAKVLDFGLAKLNRQQDPTDAHTHTLSLREETRDGVILGTVAYMSPEQVQGRTADHRSDIFALGTILYEAATRRRPFVADSDVEIMHKILHETPQPIGEINPDVPAELRRAIRRCLAKEPERRYQSMKDLAIELSEIVEEFDQLSRGVTTSSGSGAPVAVAQPVRGWKPRLALVAGIALLAMVLLAFGAYRWSRGRVAAPPPIAFETMKIRPLTTSGRAFRTPGISPDGRYVAYVTREPSGFSLWIHQVATGSDVRVVPEQATQIAHPVFSPDGNYLYYAGADPTSGNYVYSWIYVVPTIGGQPRKIVFDVDTPIAFSADGKQIAFGRGVPAERTNDLIVANADGTGERKVASFRRLMEAAGTTWTADGSSVLTAALDLKAGWDIAVMEVDVASGATRRIGSTRRFSLTHLAFLPDRSGILMTASDAESAREQLWLQPYPDGMPLRLTNDLSDYRGLAVSGDASTIAALKVDTKTGLALSTTDGSRETNVTPAGHSRLQDVTVSNTGVIAYAFANGNRTDIALLDAAGAAPRVLTRSGFNFRPAISADGRTLIFTSESENGPPHVFAIDADGSNLRQITRGEHEEAADLSADGRTILYSTAFGSEIWVQPLQGGTATRLTDRANGRGRLSPDGRHAVFLEWQSAERAAANLKIVPVDGGPAVLDLPWSRGVEFAWHPDGKTITFRRNDGGVSNLFGVRMAGGESKQLTTFTRGTFSSYCWTPDGGLVLVRTESTSDIVLITEWRRSE